MATIFEHDHLKLRISLENGRDRFTQAEIVKLMDERKTYIGGDHKHCLCRIPDGAVLAEIKRNAEGNMWQDDHSPRMGDALRKEITLHAKRSFIGRENARKGAKVRQGKKAVLVALIHDLYVALDSIHPNWDECLDCADAMKKANMIRPQYLKSQKRLAPSVRWSYSIESLNLIAGKLLAEYSSFVPDAEDKVAIEEAFDGFKARFMVL